MIFARAKPGVDLKRKLGELDLGRLGPCFDPSQNASEFLRRHGVCMAQKYASGIAMLERSG
jgi:hypothetical protein